MGFDDIAADGQTQARAPLPGGVGFGLGGEERLEDPPQVGRRDADARVGHTDLREPAGCVGRQPHTHDPPPGMAWRALIKRFSSTCWICAGLTRAYKLPVALTSSRTRFRIRSFLTSTSTSSTRRLRSVGSRCLMIARPGQTEHPSRDRGRPLRRVNDLGECTLAIGRIRIAQSQFGVVEDRRQGVVQLVERPRRPEPPGC